MFPWQPSELNKWLCPKVAIGKADEEMAGEPCQCNTEINSPADHKWRSAGNTTSAFYNTCGAPWRLDFPASMRVPFMGHAGKPIA